MDRRDYLAASLAAGAAALNEVAGADQNPAAQVAGRTQQANASLQRLTKQAKPGR